MKLQTGCSVLESPALPEGIAATSDTELVRRFKQGEESCFDELVRRYQRRIYNVVFRLVNDENDACEIAQDVFVRAYEALYAFREESALYTWLYRIAVNLSFNCLRTRKSNRVLALSNTVLAEDVLRDHPTQDTPQRELRRSELRTAIRNAVDDLPERQKAVFVLRQYTGLNNLEIARKLRCSNGAVKAHYHFAVQKLQKALVDNRFGLVQG